MKKTRFAVLSLLLFLSAFTVFLIAQGRAQAADSTKVSFERWIDSRTVDVYVQSPSTDSWVKEVRVLLPDGWAKNSTRNWPTLWLLHGGGDDYTSWTKGTDIEELSAKHDMMVVIPNTSWCSSYSDWWNYGKYGSPAWETYITSDLRKLMQDKYHADGSNAAVAGVSMGGLGAAKLALYHTDMFKAAASFSGNLDPLHVYANMDNPDSPTIGCANMQDSKKVWGDYKNATQRAMWERNDPYVQAAKYTALKYFYISSGDGVYDTKAGKSADDYLEKTVSPQNLAMVEKLNKLNVPVDSHFYSGTHSWPYWQDELHRAWPGLLKAINVQ